MHQRLELLLVVQQHRLLQVVHDLGVLALDHRRAEAAERGLQSKEALGRHVVAAELAGDEELLQRRLVLQRQQVRIQRDQIEVEVVDAVEHRRPSRLLGVCGLGRRELLEVELDHEGALGVED